MTDSRNDANGDEPTPTEGSPSSPSPASAHPDSAPASADSDAGIAEDSIRGAFPPQEDPPDLDDTDGPSWAPSAEDTKQSALSGMWGFLWDSKEERELKKAAKAAGVSPGRPSKKSAKGKTPATAVAGKAKVSRRARLLGGRRGRAVALMGLMIAVAALTVVNTLMISALFNKPDAEEAAQKALREQGRDFPSGQAVAWADQAVVDWATWDEEDKDEREVRMAQYLTAGMDPQSGWNGRGKQKVTFTSVDPEPTVIDQNHALVDVAYRLEDDSRRCVSVPVFAHKPKGLTGEGQEEQWAFGFAGNPVPRPCAPRTGAEAAKPKDTSDDGVALSSDDDLAQDLTTNFFPDFFSAWAASDANSLRQYTASGVTTIGLGGAMSSTPPPSVDEAVIMTPKNSEPKEGTVYYATVPVTWTMAGSSAQLTATYTVPMKMSGDRWYVAGEPRPASASSDASSGSPGEKVDPEEGTDNSDAPAEDEAQSPSGDEESPDTPPGGDD